MPGIKLLMAPSDVVYAYDGSLAGFYGCVHACVYGRQMPLDIQAEGEAQCSLLAPRWIETSREQALRVRAAVAQKISPRALDLCERVFLSCLPQKEMAMLRFLVLGFERGAGIVDCWADPIVSRLLKAEKHLSGEAHLLTGFIRFADYDGKLIATITPKNYVLPLIARHFVDRYAHETFLIFDKTHRAALLYEAHQAQLVEIDAVPEQPFTETERYYQALWRQFYDTIGIEARENPRCRMSHMPKRYWENMVEMRDKL